MSTDLHVSLGNRHAIGNGSSHNSNSPETVTLPDTDSSNGVSPINCPNDTDEKWFLMRASYGQEQKASEYLREEGIEVFCPRWKKERTYAGKTVIAEVSIIPNTLFVRSTEKVLHTYIGKEPLTYFHHYYKQNLDENRKKIGFGRKPITIPDEQMNSFILWVGTDSDDKQFIEESRTFDEGDYVKVTEGNFAGFKGYVTRYKRQTRVAIAIDNVGTIFTAYIPKNLLIKLNDK